MGAKDYLAERTATRITADERTRQGVKALLEARRDALELRELCVTHQADGTAEDRRTLEETAQTLGSLVRELDAAVAAAREAHRVWDQLSTVEERLRTSLGPAPTA